MKEKSRVVSIPIFIETTKVSGLNHLIKYPYVLYNNVLNSGVVVKARFSKAFKSYKDDDRVEQHWFYHTGNPRGYMLTLDLLIMILEDIGTSQELIKQFKSENKKWLS